MIILMFAVWISVMIIILILMSALSYFMSEVTEFFLVGVISFIVLLPIGILAALGFGHVLGILN